MKEQLKDIAYGIIAMLLGFIGATLIMAAF